MSEREHSYSDGRGDNGRRLSVRRIVMLACVGLLTISYVGVLYRVSRVVGGGNRLLLTAAVSLVLAALLFHVLSPRLAFLIAIVFGTVASGFYLSTIQQQGRLIRWVGWLARDSFVLLTGGSVLRLVNLRIWALGFVPAPVFLSWYLALRRRYVWSTVVGGAALTVFVLTTDADVQTTLLGVSGAVLAIGFSERERFDGSWRGLHGVAGVFAALLITAAVVPGLSIGSDEPLLTQRTGGETSLSVADDQVTAVGSISLSPERLFRVESERPAYWRVAAYDRYTGSGWIATGKSTPYDGRIPAPPGDGELVRQRFEAERDIGTMPAAAQPIAVSDAVANRTLVTAQGTLQIDGAFAAEDAYTVQSVVLDPTEEDLRTAGTDYPTAIEERYLQLPELVSPRIAELAKTITTGADSAYEEAVLVEEWLETNKEYSAGITRPQGNIVGSFLFRMDTGYCVYYASAMVVMLRTQGVPARFVLGYTPGTRGEGNEYIVRGIDSHAWVEVYFPDVGWVRFDPTPVEPRETAESRLLGQMQRGRTGQLIPVSGAAEETDATPDVASRTESPSTATPATGGAPLPEGRATNTSDPATGDPGVGSVLGLPPLALRRLDLGVLVVLMLVSTARYIGMGRSVRRLLTIYWHGPRRGPERDVERSFRRLTYLLERRYRPRRRGETVRAYVTALTDSGLDDRVRRVARSYERARYAGEVSETEATETVHLVDALVRDMTIDRLRSLWSETARQTSRE